MSKPIVFFSHSSKDKAYLILLKNKILKKTSNAVEIFQSSDGESISFGHNWVHKVEEGLNNTKLMFVFISPNSVNSNWLYFESGFSYSKGIKVIPIGINGIDIGKLAPPINLLHGFNITSFEGLNNIIAIINEEFANTFPKDFGIDDFEELLSKINIILNYNHHFNYIDYIKTELITNSFNFDFKKGVFEKVVTFLKSNKIKHIQHGKSLIYLNTMVIIINDERIEFKFDHLRLEENINLIRKFLNDIYVEKSEHYWLGIYFTDNVELITTDFKLLSRLSSVGIERSDQHPTLFKFKNILFNLDKKEGVRAKREIEGERLRIVFSLDSFEAIEISELIDILFDQKLIWEKL